MRIRRDVEEWLDAKGLGRVDFARKLNVSHISVQNWIRYGARPNPEHEKAIREKFPDCPLLGR